MSGQVIPLFPTLPGRAPPKRSRRETIEQRFETYCEQHPHVLAWLRYYALEAVYAGRRRLGIKELVERVRWQVNLQTRSDDGFKVNNSFAPLFARKLMAEEPILAGVFETRSRRTL